MFNYARSDTHFLLYIYDNMRNELIDNSDTSQAESNLIQVVMNNSKEESLQRYERPLYDIKRGLGNMGWYNLLCRTPALFNREQFAVFKAVHQWRDTVARQEDEGIHAIMSKQVLYNIAREMPTDMPSLLDCSHPISKFFHKQKEDLLYVIRQAKVEEAMEPDIKEFIGNLPPSSGQHQINATGSNQVAPASTKEVHHLALLKPLLETTPIARSGNSVFWGPNSFNEMLYYSQRIKPSNGNLCLALPLPQLTGELYGNTGAASGDLLPTIQQRLVNHGEDQSVEERNPEQVTIIKGNGPSRKRKTFETQVPPEPTPPTAQGVHPSNVQGEVIDKEMVAADKGEDAQPKLDAKRRLKKEKREAVRGGRTPLTEGAVITRGLEVTKAFDYENAPSVLHAKQKGNDAPGRGGSKAENPYVKSMDAPKGLRKKKYEEGANKSHTFKT